MSNNQILLSFFICFICLVCTISAQTVVNAGSDNLAPQGDTQECHVHTRSSSPTGLCANCVTQNTDDHHWRLVAPMDVTIECSGHYNIDAEAHQNIHGRAYQGSLAQHQCNYPGFGNEPCCTFKGAPCAGGIPPRCADEISTCFGGVTAQSQFLNFKVEGFDSAVSKTCPEKIGTNAIIRGNYVRKWESTLKCPNKANKKLTVSQTITVQDELSPELHLPADRTVECFCPFSPVGKNSSVERTPVDIGFTGDIIGITDQCLGVLFPSTKNGYDAFFPTKVDDSKYDKTKLNVAGGLSGSKTIKRTWTVGSADCQNKAASATQTITIEDTLPPTLILSNDAMDKHVQCKKDVPVKPTIFAKDACVCAQITASSTETIITGECDDHRVVERVYSATDQNNNGLNVVTYTQTITVKDDIAPRFTAVPDQFKEIAPTKNADCLALATDLTLTITDNCFAAAQTKVQQHTKTVKQGVEPGEYDIFYNWLAEDACGNKAEQLVQRRVRVESDMKVAITSPPLTSVVAAGTFINVDITNNGPCHILAKSASLYVDAFGFDVLSSDPAALFTDSLDGGEAVLLVPNGLLKIGQSETVKVKIGYDANTFVKTERLTEGFTVRGESDAFRDTDTTNNSARIAVKAA